MVTTTVIVKRGRQIYADGPATTLVVKQLRSGQYRVAIIHDESVTVRVIDEPDDDEVH